MADLAKMISSKILKAHDADSRSDKLNKGIAIVFKSGFELCGFNLDQLAFCGSSRDGLKVCKIGDMGDMDIMVANSIIQDRIEEQNFKYDEKFPCHCKVLVGGELVKREMLSKTSFEVSPRLWETLNLYEYNKTEGGIQGYKFYNWFFKLHELSKFVYLLKRVLIETRKEATLSKDSTHLRVSDSLIPNIEEKLKIKEATLSNDSTHLRLSDSLIPNIEEKLNMWEKDYSETEGKQFLYVSLQLVGLFRLMFGASGPEEAIPKFMADVFHKDTIIPDQSSFPTLFSNVAFFGTILKYSIDFVSSFYVSGWPRPAMEWISRIRNWPSNESVSIIATEGFNLVGKPSPKSEEKETDFYLSFARAECKLCQSLSEDQKFCYLAFKILIKFGVDDDNIKSYFIRTAFLWVCESVNPADWDNSKLLTNLHTLVNFLIEAYRSQTLQHYFVPEMNLLARTSDDICNDIVLQLSQIIRKVPVCFHEVFERNGNLIIYDAIA